MLTLMIHPLVQTGAIALAVYVFYLGFQRFRMRHLHQKAVFNWKMHVDLGQAAFSLLLLGFLVAPVVTYFRWGGPVFSTDHGQIGIFMLLLILSGFASGRHMDRNRKKRRLLPLLHGVNNLILLLLCILQIFSGLRMVAGILFRS